MASPTGFVGITLEGVDIPIATQQPVARRRELKSILESGPGGAREQLAWQPAGYPVRTYKMRFTLTWAHLRGYYDQVEEILAGAGPFAFCFWKPVHLRYLGDGVRVEYFLPHELGVATDTLTTPPGGASIIPFLPVVKIGLSSDPLTYSKVDATTYATGPSAGNVYFLAGGTKFKLPSAPAAGAAIVVRYVPLYAVFEVEASEKRYTDPIREPRAIELVER